MILSVVIVSYNVKELLEKCLISVNNAREKLDGKSEVVVIDNNSSDESMRMLVPKFPNIIFLSNIENVGFAKACNQGAEASSGKYVLFLNPDTEIPDDSLARCIMFMEAHPRAGALGVRMIDTDNRYLRESKRGYPSPAASFYKLTGIADLFPRSRHLAKYYLGHLPENVTQKVDVLSGAFMLVRREVLRHVGGFDEKFFMYGEDIDLSYRIQKAGYENHYLADVTILHHKGKSTPKDKKYRKMFFDAMIIFVNKHYKNKPFTSALLKAGIWLKRIAD